MNARKLDPSADKQAAEKPDPINRARAFVAEGEARDFEARQAKGYRELETPIGLVRSQSAVLKIVAEDCLAGGTGYWEERFKKEFPALAGYRVLVLTPMQADALDYAVQHMVNLAEDLFGSYYGTHDPAALEA
jgi:hypothetical protein